MGSAGRAIGPDGKPLKQQDNKNHTKKGGVQQRNSGKNQNNRNNQGNRFNKGGQRFDNPNLRGSDTGPRPLMASSGGPMNGPMRGPMGGPMGLSMGQRPGPAPFDIPLGFGIIPGASAGPDPTGSYGGFFASSKMNDGGNGPAPSAALLHQRKELQQTVVPPVKQNVPISLIGSHAKAPETQQSSSGHVGEVPGFGNNSSIHELFGKMVWRKMEQLRDQHLVDELQNKIMNLIHDALAAQNAVPTQALNRGAFVQHVRRF